MKNHSNRMMIFLKTIKNNYSKENLSRNNNKLFKNSRLLNKHRHRQNNNKKSCKLNKINMKKRD